MELKLGIVLFVILCIGYGANAQTCTAAGRYAVTGDTTCKNYTLCVALSNGSFIGYNYVCPTTSLFNPASGLCTTNYNCTVTSTNTTNTTTSRCTEDGFIADSSSTNCSSYILCVEVNGIFIEQTLSCPDGTFYNPNTTDCESDYNCTTTTAFSCTAAGRYADTTDTTCQSYFYCVLASNGTFVQYNYTCPSTSVFSPTSRVCTTTYTCPTA